MSGKQISQPLDAMNIRGEPSDGGAMFDFDAEQEQPQNDVRVPWFVLGNGSTHPDVYWARRRRARRIGLFLGSTIVAGVVAAVLFFPRDRIKIPEFVSQALPDSDSVATVATNDLPPIAPPPLPVEKP